MSCMGIEFSRKFSEESGGKEEEIEVVPACKTRGIFLALVDVVVAVLFLGICGDVNG